MILKLLKKYGNKSICMVLFLVPLLIHAQTNFENTIPYDAEQGSPKADLKAISWISGHWKGEAFGGITEEVWTPPAGGSMMCVFKLIVENQVKFYEIVTITEANGSLLLQLKHFDRKLHGWEEKDETVDFNLVKVTANKVFFDEFTFERIGANEMNIYVIIDDHGKREEVKFSYKKVGS